MGVPPPLTHADSRPAARVLLCASFVLLTAPCLSAAGEAPERRPRQQGQPGVAARFVQHWGSKGKKPGEFRIPIGVAIGPGDEVFTTDFYNDRVQRFSAAGKLLSCYAVKPYPTGIAVGPKGNVYLSHFSLNRTNEESKRDRVTVYDAAGKLLREWGKTGKGDGEFDAPGGIAVSKAGEVYVADQTNRRIQVFTAEGKFLRKWGRHGSEQGQFGGKVPVTSRWGGPHFLALDSSGNVYTTEGADCRVQKFTAEGKFLLTWGDGREGVGNFGRKLAPIQAGINGPIGICVDAKDRVWVAAVGGRVQQFSGDGKLLQAIGEKQGEGPGEFQAPHGVATDSQGNLYVADGYNHRIQKFATSAGR